MPYLMRVELPDVPGSLGRVATAIGEAGGDIDAIEIVEKRDGFAVDDVLLEMAHGTMPDSVVSACGTLDGVSVLWINRYAAGGNLFLDLEVVEALTEDPSTAPDRLVEMLPVAFRVDWAARVTPGVDGVGARVVHATDAAPSAYDVEQVATPTRLPGDEVYVECAAPFGDDLVLMGRRGGPEFLDSELARFGHLLGLAMTISRA
ncbi:ACT domain-containing protein [Nocardioides sp. zg-1228]|uniref:ACT domain-containing protein n=1 Tax=Nocardioides sp. zg-1228 TaxID=2763008 RepID=UPI0016432224|nr:ACT domain-containing protein [Nocardioides sp. zg-1228]MBC2932348.1 ACT domain-containing protein [Nocardioides sp. zg-1228]QSF57863.1 ACT domain-containing protein [Nocardioides sp. zg-1228]